MSQATIFRGPNGKWGIEEPEGLLYEPEFTHEIAARIAELENQPVPPKDWEETADIVRRVNSSPTPHP